MNIIKILLLILVLNLMVTASVISVSDCPLGEDSVLTNNQAARQFFEARAEDTQCRQELNRLMDNYRSEKRALETTIKKTLKKSGKLSAAQETLLDQDWRLLYRSVGFDIRKFLTNAEADAIDAGEIKVSEALVAARPLMERCGWCATRRLEETTENSGTLQEQTWYLSDGSCQLEGLSDLQKKKAFDHLIASLLSMKKYPKRFGGFTRVIEFRGKDMNTDKVTGNSFISFVAVPGIDVLRFFFGFYILNTIEKPTRTNPDTFSIRFQETARPNDFPQSTSIPDFGLSGKGDHRRFRQLYGIRGRWIVQTDGYIRYCTTADFQMKFPAFLFDAASDQARETSHDTLVEAYERAREIL